jgi:hypothetical protein
MLFNLEEVEALTLLQLRFVILDAIRFAFVCFVARLASSLLPSARADNDLECFAGRSKFASKSSRKQVKD